MSDTPRPSVDEPIEVDGVKMTPREAARQISATCVGMESLVDPVLADPFKCGIWCRAAIQKMVKHGINSDLEQSDIHTQVLKEFHSRLSRHQQEEVERLKSSRDTALAERDEARNRCTTRERETCILFDRLAKAVGMRVMDHTTDEQIVQRVIAALALPGEGKVGG